MWFEAWPGWDDGLKKLSSDCLGRRIGFVGARGKEGLDRQGAAIWGSAIGKMICHSRCDVIAKMVSIRICTLPNTCTQNEGMEIPIAL